MPKGLIPLMLTSPGPSATSFGSRSSVMFPSDHNSTKYGASSRKVSVSPPISPAHKRNFSDVTPIIKLSRPPVKAPKMRRQSQQIPASLPAIPFSSTEWKKAITEIKQYHVTRRFRACSARCNEILTNIKNITAVEPAYLIYLNFYAATSLEMCAKPLAPASAYRISLLQQARSHYERAAALIQTAEETVLSRSRSSSAASSLPSLHSPSGSVSSRAWTPDCGIMTPTSSVSRKSNLAREPLTGEPRSRPAKKKVSFELPKDKSRWSFTLSEPAIRPDSPTLGFDDEYFAAGAMRQELPEIPTRRASKQDFEMPTPSPPSMPSISESEELSPADSPSTDASGDEYPFFRHDHSDPESARSLARYCDTLASLKTQVANHKAALEKLIERDAQLQKQQQQQEQVRAESPSSHDPASQVTASLNRMSLGARQRSGSSASVSIGISRRSSSMSLASSDSGDADAAEARSRERRARIDRLRMNGWKRQRFDVSRYEELCDTVMEELNRG